MDVLDDTPTKLLEEMRSLFCDLRFFEGSVAAQLKLAIADISRKSIDINFATVKKFAHRYYATGRFVTKEDIDMWKEIQWIFTTCCVLIVSKRPETIELFWDKPETMLANYPSFSNVKPLEMELLLRFRNMVVATLQVVSPRHNKQLILYIAGRLEGTQRRYVTGSGMSEAVKRRVAIYEQEGKVEPEPRPDRINPVIRSIQIKRAEEIRKASAASRMTEGGGLTKRESSESFQTSSGFEMPTVKLEYPHSVLESVARMAAKEANLQKDPTMLLAGKRSYDHMSHGLGVGLGMGNMASYQALIKQEKKSATGDTDVLIDNQLLEGSKNASMSIFFHKDPTNMSPLLAPTASSSSSSSTANVAPAPLPPLPPLPGNTFKNTFGFLDVLAAAASEVSEKEVKEMKLEGSPRFQQQT